MKTFRLHDTASDWPHLANVAGIQYYWNRALVQGGVVLVHGSPSADFTALLEDYARLGMSPEVIYVPDLGGSLYEDLLASPAHMEMLRRELSSGAKLDFFCASPAAKAFADAAGLDWSRQVTTPTPELFEHWGRKDVIREELARAGHGPLCPSHHIARSVEDVRHWVRHFSENGVSGIFLKRPDMASGEGMMVIPKGGDPELFIRQYWDPRFPVIVEAAHEHIPFSVVLKMTDEGVCFRHGSLQWQGRHTPLGERLTLRHLMERDFEHRGNMVGSEGVDLGPLKYYHIQAAQQGVEPLGQLMWKSGFRGEVSIDLAEVTGMSSLILEANPRTSHSMLVAAVLRALERQFEEKLVVLGANVEGVSPRISSYLSARECVPNFCDGSSPEGVIFYHTPLLSAGLEKCGLFAVGRSFEEATHHFNIAQQALCA